MIERPPSLPHLIRPTPIQPIATTRILLIGHALPVGTLEAVLLRNHAPNYLCVDSLSAGDWLLRDGFEAELIVVHSKLFASSSAEQTWRQQHAHAVILSLAAVVDVETLERQVAACLSLCRERRKPATAVGSSAQAALPRQSAQGSSAAFPR